MSRLFVARQPIFDRRARVVGYELLYRTGTENAARIDDPEQATARVLVDTFSELGLDELVGARRAFLNFTRDFLVAVHPLPLPADRVVIELLENQTIDDELVATLEELTAEGFALALDDVVLTPELEPLLDLATIVKVDVLDLGPERATEHIHELHDRGLSVVAEKVETKADYARYHALDCAYFQGYFFARPEVMDATRMPSGGVEGLGTLVRIEQSGPGFDELEEMLSADVALSYRLLRYMNSAFFSLKRPVASVHEALVTLGARTVRQWATVLALAELAEDSPHELLVTGLTRARMCAALAPDDESAQTHFTVGLFSVLDALLDTSLFAALDELPLSDEVRDALLRHTGSAGLALAETLAYERGAFSEPRSPAQMAGAYGPAVSWADAAASATLT